MALVTLQRSPSHSSDSEEDCVDGKGSGCTVHWRRSGESYFAMNGAALILPYREQRRRQSRRSHCSEIQNHLQCMLDLLRPEDELKVAIRLENPRGSDHRYIALVSTIQEKKDSVILGMDCSWPNGASKTPQSSPTVQSRRDLSGCKRGCKAIIGLVLPICKRMEVRLSGDGSAIQSLHKATQHTDLQNYLDEGPNNTWFDYYRSRQDKSNIARLSSWNMMEDVESFVPVVFGLTNENEYERVKLLISARLQEIMLSVDLDAVSCRSIRLLVEDALGMKLDQFRSFVDEEMMRIFGQLDAPSRITDHLYLGSEWNAANLAELRALGIEYILNISREIDNFFTGLFHYFNVRLYDTEHSDLLKYWPKTHKFISKARDLGLGVLVHCKMGVSRSASTVIAYLMKENRWTVEEAIYYVKECRSCIRPNNGFMLQLKTYEGILNASNKREVFRPKSDEDSSRVGDTTSEDDDAFPVSSFRHLISGYGVADASWTTSANREESCVGGRQMSSVDAVLETDSRGADSAVDSLPTVSSSPFELGPLWLPPTISTTSSARTDEQVSVSKIMPDNSWIRPEAALSDIHDDVMDTSHTQDAPYNSTCTSVEMLQEHGDTSVVEGDLDPAVDFIESSNGPGLFACTDELESDSRHSCFLQNPRCVDCTISVSPAHVLAPSPHTRAVEVSAGEFSSSYQVPSQTLLSSGHGLALFDDDPKTGMRREMFAPVYVAGVRQRGVCTEFPELMDVDLRVKCGLIDMCRQKASRRSRDGIVFSCRPVRRSCSLRCMRDADQQRNLARCTSWNVAAPALTARESAMGMEVDGCLKIMPCEQNCGFGEQISDTGEQISDTRRQISDTGKQISDTRGQVCDTRRQVCDTKGQIYVTGKQISDTGEQISDTGEQISDTGEQISDTREQMSDSGDTREQIFSSREQTAGGSACAGPDIQCAHSVSFHSMLCDMPVMEGIVRQQKGGIEGRLPAGAKCTDRKLTDNTENERR